VTHEAAAAAPGHASIVDLAIVVPTFNEAGNVRELVARVDAALPGVSWEMIFVDDDSPDGTAAVVRNVARRDARVRCIQRLGRRGLTSACLEGMLSSSAPCIAVMDADLQHDERLLPDMLRLLQRGDTDIVVGSRYAEGGGTGQWKRSRARASRLATRLSRMVLRADLTDPMSGFFMMRHDAAVGCVRAGMSGIGFKILVDLFASSPRPLRFREVPYEFRPRFAGASKLDSSVAWEYVLMLLDKLVGRIVPVRFIAFSLVGAVGVGVHLLVLGALYRGMAVSFVASQAVATLVAMTSNFLMNNLLTYRDMRLRGPALLRGWLSFVVACSIGALANVGVAAYLYGQETFWVTSAIAGVLVGSVWNYAVTAVYTWRSGRHA
jgi:dolichol-phosphate mannosyltransferase